MNQNKGFWNKSILFKNQEGTFRTVKDNRRQNVFNKKFTKEVDSKWLQKPERLWKQRLQV